MTRLSLKDRLRSYFERNSGIWIASGDIQRMVAEKTDYTPQNVGRRLRELENEGAIEVRYEKNHAYYRCGESAESLNGRQLDWFLGLPNGVSSPNTSSARP